MIKRFQSIYSCMSWLWLVILIVLASYSTNTLFVRGNIQFDLLALLPASKTNNMKDASQLVLDTNLSGRVLVLLGHQDLATAKSGLNQLRHETSNINLPLKEQKSQALQQEYQAFFKQLYPHRAGLLAPDNRKQLLAGNGELIAKRALTEIMSPLSSLQPIQLESDPFFLYPNFVQSSQENTVLHRDDDGDVYIKDNGKVWYLFRAQLTKPAFSLQIQEEISNQLLPILDNLHTQLRVEVLKTGAVFYASAGANQANKEISIISTVSILAIILILFAVFRTLRPVVFASLIIASGLIGGLSICLLVFGSIHILALVFGCSLIGVTVDYALHYYCANYKYNKTPDKDRLIVLKSLMPAMPLGVFSSTLGYCLLFIAPFPGVQQMAILAAAGLVCAFISVCLWGPQFIKHNNQQIPPFGQRIQLYLVQAADLGKLKYCRIMISVALIALFCVGGALLTFNDNIRNFQSLDAHLKIEENRIKAIINFDVPSKLFVVRGDNLENILQITEKIADDLDLLKKNNELSSYRSITAIVPSMERQRENRQLVREQIYKNQWDRFAQVLGLQNSVPIHSLGLKAPLFALDKANIEALPEGWNVLVHPCDSGWTGRILLDGVKNIQAIEGIAAKYASVSYVDPVQEYSNLFASYRQIVMGLILAVLLSITLLLAVRKGIKPAVTVVFPVIISILASVGIIGLLGMPFNLFHAMGLLLVLCIGIDYAFFLYWKKPVKDAYKEGDLLLLANGLAALTTILSFGLLSFSKTTAIHSFGISVFIGIVLCFCVTTLFLGESRRQS